MHKYAYVHGDPIQGVDPSGKFVGVATIVGLAVGSAVHAKLQSSKAAADIGRLKFAILEIRAITWASISTLTTAHATGGVGSVFKHLLGIPTPLTTPGFRRPARDQNSLVFLWERNIQKVLNDRVDASSDATADQKVAAKSKTREIARVYVEAVRQYNEDNFSPANPGSPGGWFGWGSGPHGWSGNWVYGPQCNCASWTEVVVNAIRNQVDLTGTGWRLRAHWDTDKNGEALLATLTTHSYTSLSFEPNGRELAKSASGGSYMPYFTPWEPDVILDPWPEGRPDLFGPGDYGLFWPWFTGRYEDY